MKLCLRMDLRERCVVPGLSLREENQSRTEQCKVSGLNCVI